MVVLTAELTFLIFKVSSESSVLTLKGIDDRAWLSVSSSHGKVTYLVTKHLVLLLDGFILSAVNSLVIGRNSGFSIVKAHAETLNGVILSFEFAVVVVRHRVCVVLQPVILLLDLNQLSLELLNLITASCERLREVTPDSITAFEG